MAAPPRRVCVVGAGLAGLAAAVAAAEAGADVMLLERRDEPGGASAQSAGWIWRYADLATARRCAPAAHVDVQRAVVERLDDDIDWLVRHGARVVGTGTGRTFTTGRRFDPPQLVDALVRALAERSPGALHVRAGAHDARRSIAGDGGLELLIERGGDATWERCDAVVLAGGGYVTDLVRVAERARVDLAARDRWVLRATRGGDGSSLALAASLGASRPDAGGACFVRVAPPPHVTAPTLVQPFGELLASDARLVDLDGAPVERPAHDWSGAAMTWRLATTTGAGRIELPRAVLRSTVHAGSVASIVRAAAEAGAPTGSLASGGAWVAAHAGITSTLDGLRVDADARVHGVPHLFAAGCDAAGTGLGGTASGLAQALVLGRRAGRAAAACS